MRRYATGSQLSSRHAGRYYLDALIGQLVLNCTVSMYSGNSYSHAVQSLYDRQFDQPLSVSVLGLAFKNRCSSSPSLT